jgi:hypothetical protein
MVMRMEHWQQQETWDAVTGGFDCRRREDGRERREQEEGHRR